MRVNPNTLSDKEWAAAFRSIQWAKEQENKQVSGQ